MKRVPNTYAESVALHSPGSPRQRRDDKEVWRVEVHHERRVATTEMIYTTDYARRIPREPPAEAEPGGKPPDDETK